MLAYPPILAITCRSTFHSSDFFETFSHCHIHICPRETNISNLLNLWPSSCWPKTKQPIPKIKRRVITVPACKRSQCQHAKKSLLACLTVTERQLTVLQAKPLLASLHWFAKKADNRIFQLLLLFVASCISNYSRRCGIYSERIHLFANFLGWSFRLNFASLVVGGFSELCTWGFPCSTQGNQLNLLGSIVCWSGKPYIQTS